jgi:hypothetical protein
MIDLRPLRRSAAKRLRRIADGLEPPGQLTRNPGRMPLIRLGGRWWSRDDLVPALTTEDAETDVQLLP